MPRFSANVRRLFMLAALVASSVRCARSQSNSRLPLSGRWIITDGNLRASLSLTQRGDSLIGTGTYALARPAELGCGGETLAKTGEVSLNGQKSLLAADPSRSQVEARLRFVPGDWEPPFIGTVEGRDSVVGGLMSVDRGRCPLVFVRER